MRFEKAFSPLIADKYTDISYQEQLALCFWWADAHLDANENFVGPYTLSQTLHQMRLFNDQRYLHSTTVVLVSTQWAVLQWC